MFDKQRYQNIYRQKNAKYIKALNRKYYQINKDIILKRHKIYYKKYWLINRSLINKSHREYYNKTRGKWHKQYSEINKIRINEMKLNKYYQYNRFKICKGKTTHCFWTTFDDWILKKMYHKIPNYELVYLFDKNIKNYNLVSRAKRLGLSINKSRLIIESNEKRKGKSFEELYGLKKAKLIRIEISKRYSGKGNPSYIHGKSKEPYSMNWNNTLKEIIRNRDRKCAICNISRQKHIEIFGRDLEVHHINGKKKNCSSSNLICLCMYHHKKIILYYKQLSDYFHAKLLRLIS